VRRATIEINVDATRLLVGDVNALSRVLLREVYSREVAQGKGRVEAVVRSLSAEARDVGATQLAVVVRSAFALSAAPVTPWSLADEALAAWRCARARGIGADVVVGCVRTRRERPSGEPWTVSRGPIDWHLCAADGQRTFSTTLADGRLADEPPPWLRTERVALVGDEVSLARSFDALQGQVHLDATALPKKLAQVNARRHSTAALAAAQLELLLALARDAGIARFTYLRSFGLCLGALLDNDLFYRS